MVVAVMKTHFPKMRPQVVSYRKCKDFHNETSLDSLRHELNVQEHFLNEKGLDAFSTIFTEVFEAIMTRRRLRNRFLKNRSEENQKLFCKQRNKCLSLLRKSKKGYLATLNEKKITDSKSFWKTVKTFLSKKPHLSEIINLTEEDNNSLLTICEEVAEELNNFANGAENLNISNYENSGSLTENIDDPTLNRETIQVS